MASIVDDVTQWAQELGLTRDAANELQVRICSAWGGCEPYVPKRPALQRQVAMGQALRTGGSVSQAFVAAGVSERHGYRLLSRPLRRR